MSFAYLRHLESLLASVDSAFSDAERKARARHQALEEAKTAFHVAEQEKRTLGRSRDGLQRAIAEARRDIQYSAMIPDEVLSLVFAHAAAGGAATISSAKIDWALARLPRTLRLVCKRWDAVALGTRELWTYVAVPATLEFITRPGFLAYLALQLERSGSLPLNVLVDARFELRNNKALFGTRGNAISLQAEFLRKAFNLLVTRDTTARIAMLAVTGGPPKPDEASPSYFPSEQNNIRHLTMGLLRLPTPVLEEAYLLIDPEGRDGGEPWDTSPADPSTMFFPVAPKLRVLQLAYMPVMCYPPHPGLPSLERLLFEFVVCYESHLVGMLSLCPALREIDSSIENTRSTALPGVSMPESVTVPVRSLVIGWEDCSSSVCRLVSLPHVTSLNIAPWRMFCDELHVQFAPTVTDLYLEESDDLYQEDIDRLCSMTLVENFTVWIINTIDLGYLVDCLCRPASPMWPRLKTFEIGGSVGQNGGAELIRLARHRAAARAGTAGGVAVVALESIKFREWEVANWVLAQLKSILGEERVVATERK